MLATVTVATALWATAAAVQEPQVRDSLGIRIVENAGPAFVEGWKVTSEPRVTIGVAEGDPAYELYRVVGAVLLSADVLVIANGGSNELRWYSAAGEHIRTVGGSGGGPGEFSMVSDVFHLGEDSVAVYDMRARRLSVFDSNGEFIRSTQVPADEALRIPRLIHRFHDGSFLAVPGGFALGGQGPTRVERLPFNVHRYQPTTGTMEMLAPNDGLEVVIGPTSAIGPDGRPRIAQNFRAFGRNTTIVGYGDGWILGDNGQPELQYWSLSDGLRVLARWRTEPRPTTRADIEEYKSRLLERYEDPARRRRMEAAWDAWPAPPRTKPYFGDEMHTDLVGNVWVRAFASARDGANGWSVFDNSGVWLADVILPTHDRILAIGSNRVVLLQRTELDVELVTIHEIEKT